MKVSDINIRDPFILTYQDKYYMYGSRVGQQTGFDVYISEDLEEWSGPKAVFEKTVAFWGTRDFWAPEVHLYKGRFYMFASFKCDGKCRGTQILVSDTPDGTFVENSCGPVTPDTWECLDGTLYVDVEGRPYIVFCHEWMQIGDGTVCMSELSEDLTCAVSEPVVLWKATDTENVSEVVIREDLRGFVTDGPFLIQDGTRLAAIWSTFIGGEYVEVIARSDDGTISGKWSVDKKPLYDKDGGHGMIFRTFDGAYKFVFHVPNCSPLERPCIKDITLEQIFDRA